MKRLFLLLIAVVPLVLSAQTSSSSIEGSLIDYRTGSPIAKATLDLQSLTNSIIRYPASTGTDGAFVFRNVEPGRYTLTAGRNGYVRQQYGQRGPNGNAATLTVVAGQRLTEVRMSLIRSSAISGRLIDTAGEVIPDAQVHVWKVSYRDGWRMMIPVASMASNDLGEYRLFGLAPGQYLLTAQPEPSDTIRSPSYAGLAPPMPGAVVTSFSAGQGGTISDPATASTRADVFNAPIFFGGNSDPFSGAMIYLASGDDHRNPDLVVDRVPMLTITGSVVDVSTGMPVRNARIVVTPYSPALQFTTASVVNVTGGRIVVDNTTMIGAGPNGDFRSPTMPPGVYLLTAFTDSAGGRLGGQVKVDLKNSSLTGIRIPVASTRVIAGQVAGLPAADVARVRVGLKSTAASLLDVPLQNTSNGQFKLSNAVAGDYVVSISGVDEGYVKSIRLGNLDLLNDTLHAGEIPQGEIQVVLSDKAGRVRGVARNESGAPFSNITVVLIPDQLRQRFDLYQSITTDANGAFHFEHIAPGQYKLFAWEDIEKDAWRDSGFMRLFEATGEELSIGEGATVEIDTAVIRQF